MDASASKSYAFARLARVTVQDGRILSISQEWSDGEITAEFSDVAFSIMRYSDTGVSINAGNAQVNGSRDNLTYTSISFYSAGKTTILDLAGLSDGTYYVVSAFGETVDMPSGTIAIDKFYATSTYPQRLPTMDVICGYVVIADGKVADVRNYGTTSKYLSIYYGAFALRTDGKKVKMLGGAVNPGGDVPTTDLEAKDSYVTVVISYDAENGYAVTVRQDNDGYYSSTEREVAVRIGSISMNGDYVHVFQQWTYGNIQVLGRVL